MSERPDVHIDDSQDEVSLTPVIQKLWPYRRMMALAFAAIAVAYMCVMLITYAVVPRERLATIGFRLTFSGAEQDQYPNGTTFSSAEIVATPILEEVFRKNELGRYMSFSDFKDGLFVVQASRELDILSAEYQAKLADTRLTAVDRSRLEAEFQTKRASLKSAQFSLNLRRNERLIKVSDTLLSKALNDTLSTWAEQAATRKGALRYNVAVLSKAVLKKDFLTADDYVVAADVLRTTIERVLDTVERLAQIPGAEAVRLGKDQIALADLRAGLQDILQFEVDPLLAVIRTSGLARNRARVDAYFADRSFDVQLAKEQAAQRIRTVQDALRAYQSKGTVDVTAPLTDRSQGTTVVPQLSESFIDQLVRLSTGTVDMEYRQRLTNRIIEEGTLLADLNRQAEYYALMRRSFSGAHGFEASSADAATVTRRMKLAYDEVSVLMDQIQAFYKQVSDHNLNPATVLYSITGPYSTRTISPLTPRTIGLYLFLTLFAAMIVVPFACLVHAYFRQWTSPSSGTGAPPRRTESDKFAGV